MTRARQMSRDMARARQMSRDMNRARQMSRDMNLPLRKSSTDVEVVTFGCRLNAYESEIIRKNAVDAGAVDSVVFNTCAVTTEAERQARQAIRRARRDRPGAKIIVTGCAAQISPEAYADMPEVDQVIGNEEKLKSNLFDLPEEQTVHVSDIMAVRETAPHLVEGFENRARAFLQIQTGCDHRCTFCIIPFGRGNSRSVGVGAVVDQAKILVAAGHAEIVLTGVDISSYGGDLPGRPRLTRLILALLKNVPGLTRLRLSSLDVDECDDDFLNLVASEPRIMPHLHLSLQAGDDLILKRMKRRHSRADAIQFCAAMRAARPEIVFGADLITGFPTETEEMFQKTFDLIEECGLTHLHVFPYSPRPETPAAKMPQVEVPVRKERAARLRKAGEVARHLYLTSRIGTTSKILVEKATRGRSEDYFEVDLDQEYPAGAIVSVRLFALNNGVLTAQALDGPSS